MSRYEELRTLAEKATPGKPAAGTFGFTAEDEAYLLALRPDVILALLDERERLRDALEELADDTEHIAHDCGDTDCCVAVARQVLEATA